MSDITSPAYVGSVELSVVLAECLLFWAVFQRPSRTLLRDRAQDFAVVALANVASYLAGEVARIG
jgi:hypothetical protein